jgi:hypothetical protein
MILADANFDSEVQIVIICSISFPLAINVSVKMFVTFSSIKIHSRIVIFTLLVRRMKLTMMHASENGVIGQNFGLLVAVCAK